MHKKTKKLFFNSFYFFDLTSALRFYLIKDIIFLLQSTDSKLWAFLYKKKDYNPDYLWVFLVGFNTLQKLKWL